MKTMTIIFLSLVILSGCATPDQIIYMRQLEQQRLANMSVEERMQEKYLRAKLQAEAMRTRSNRYWSCMYNSSFMNQSNCGFIR